MRSSTSLYTKSLPDVTVIIEVARLDVEDSFELKNLKGYKGSKKLDLFGRKWQLMSAERRNFKNQQLKYI